MRDNLKMQKMNDKKNYLNGVLLALFGGVLAGVPVLATNNFWQWKSELCYLSPSKLEPCTNCSADTPHFILDPGVHWDCEATPSGWPKCLPDTRCDYTVSKKCNLCGANGLSDFLEHGPVDNLVSD
jgi:hypothetical protein